MAGRDKTISDAKFLYYFAVSDKPVLTVSQLEEKIDLTRQGIYNRLEDLQQNGYLKSMNVGASAKVWWLTDDGEQYVQDRYFSGAESDSDHSIE
jgi:predicted ArsR family transcriptional regulator